MTESDFIRAVTADPDDDTVRLAFADWLDEQGKPGRAQFIRVQIERARLDRFDPRQSALMATEARLIAEHSKDIIGGFAGFPDFRLRRGFVEMIQCSADIIARDLDYCCAIAPIREIRLTGMTESGLGAKLGAVKELAQIERLEINDLKEGRHEMAETHALLRSPHWKKMRELTLVTGIERTELLAALDHPGFAGLRAIHLNNLEADNLVDALTDRPHLPVESIWVHHGHMGACSLTNEGLRKLVNTPHWARLSDLDVGAVPMGYEWAEYEEVLPKSALKRLVLRAPSINVGLSGDCNGVLAAKSWGPIESFGFHGLAFDTKDLEKLRNHPSAGQLKELILTRSRIKQPDLDVLFTSPGLSNLRRFHVNADYHSGVLAEPEAAPMANLVELRCGLAASASESIARSPHMGRLRLLHCNFEKPNVARAVADSTMLPSLNWLALATANRFNLDADTARALATNPALANLVCVDLLGGRWEEANLAPVLDSTRPWVRLELGRVADAGLKKRAQERMKRTKVYQPPTDECREDDWYPD
jgi:uncharacterized protein (TIGR02996 family)